MHGTFSFGVKDATALKLVREDPQILTRNQKGKTSMACVRQTSKRNFFPVRPLASILPAGRNPENNCLFPKMNWPVEPFSCRHSRCKSERIGRRFRRRRGNLRRFRRRGTHGRNDHDQDWRAVTAGEWLNRPPSDFRGCCTGAADMPPGSTYVHTCYLAQFVCRIWMVYVWFNFGQALDALLLGLLRVTSKEKLLPIQRIWMMK